MPRHAFDALSLIFGLLFGAVAALAFVGPAGQIIDPRWIGPAILVLIGLALLMPRRPRRRPHDDAETMPDRESDLS